jgi:deazaflavin-dependent oxidoreductase (nitroreductase family)
VKEEMPIALIILAAIPLTGMLMMRFRKKTLARFNLAVTNRITGQFAGWLPLFGIMSHVGRKSGKIYRTPVNVFRTPNGFVIALTYGRESEWVKNVLAAGGCELQTRGRHYRLSDPMIVHDPTRKQFPWPVRAVLGIVGANEFMNLASSSALSVKNRGTRMGHPGACEIILARKNVRTHRQMRQVAPGASGAGRAPFR